MYQGYEMLKVAREGKIVTVSLNRPDLMNATNAQMHQELERVFPEIGRDPDANVVILTGAGRAFSAGGDISTLRSTVDDPARWNESMREARALLYGIVDLDRPIIAKINGHAIGMGATLALFCDITIAKDSAKIGDPHVSVGLSAGDGGSLIWPELIGYARAKYYLLTGKPITGAEAAAIGLITEAVPGDQLDARVAEIAEELANGASTAIRLTKKSINLGLRQKLDMLIDAHLGHETLTYLSHDHCEALDAFLEGRPAVFTGR